MKPVRVAFRYHLFVGDGIPGGRASGRLDFDPAEPFAVRLWIADDNVWVFDRALLAAGLINAIGDGDVRIIPGEYAHAAEVMVVLASDDGAATLLLPRTPVETFVRAVDATLPIQRAAVDVDGFLAELLGGR
jgi:hypothetical protein